MKKLLILCVLSVSSLFASIGEVTVLRGDATLLRDGHEHVIKKGTTLEKHDEIHTGKTAKLQITFNDKTIISLGKNSDFKIDEYIFTPKNVSAQFSVGKGFFQSITGKIGKIAPKRFKVKTANATIGVRGTTIVGEVTANRDIIACSYGQIVVSNDKGSMLVNAGERTIVEEMKSPKQARKINTILLKQLALQSVLTVQEKEEEKPKKVENTKAKKELSAVNEEKSTAKFEPWAEENGVKSLSDIEDILGESTPSYSGKVVDGSTSFGAIDKESSDVKLGFDLGTGAMDGNMKFDDGTNNYDVDVAGKIEGDGSFGFNSNNGYDGGGQGALSGENLEHANGDFAFSEKNIVDDSTNEIKGNFETTHEK